MLNYNEISQRKYIELDGVPYEVIESNVSRKQKQKPVNQTKLKNLKTGKVMERSFHASETVKEADIEIETIVYLYSKVDARTGVEESWFRKKDNHGERFSLPQDVVGEATQYIKENDEVEALMYNDETIGLRVPIKVTLAVKEAPPAVKGNTAQGGAKPVVLETGLTVSAPLFIKEGDQIVVNTQTGEYVERISN